MTRFTLSLLALGSSALFAVGGAIAPVPQLPGVKLQPEMKADPADEKAEDPASIADRISENTKKAGDKLGELDTGEQTRKTQEQVLKDIDKLLNQPPMDNNSGGGGGGENKNDPNQSSSSNPQGGQQSNPQGGGMNQPKPQGGSGGMKQPPSGGTGGGQASKGGSRREQRERERQQGKNGEQPMPMASTPQPMPMATNAKPMPMRVGNSDPQPAQAANADGMKPTGANNDGGVGGKSLPALPLDDAITKQVWGHLPERLRQQMNQYYREQFMPKYSDLLRDYYSSLAEKEISSTKK